ncbi:MAG: N-acetylmuramoyl-L-alanine amidase [Paraclostridium sp.]
MKILITYAHTEKGKGTGAIGHINESKESRILSDEVVSILKDMGHDVTVKGVMESSNYLKELCDFENKSKYDVSVQTHFNSYGSPIANGTETFYYSSSSKGREIASRVNNKLKQLFVDRGIKTGNDLYWIRNTKNPAILIETCFVSNQRDCDIYRANLRKIAILISEGITGQTYNKQQNQNCCTEKLKSIADDINNHIKNH